MKTVLFSGKPLPDPLMQTLKSELAVARGDLQQAYQQFDEALDPELIEACIYQISAVKARCNYLIRAIKSRETASAAAAAALSEEKEDAAWT